MSEENEKKQIREFLSGLHVHDARQSPSFESVWNRAKIAKNSPNPFFRFAMAFSMILVFGLTIVVFNQIQKQKHRGDFEALSKWQAPSDVLLQMPGQVRMENQNSYFNIDGRI